MRVFGTFTSPYVRRVRVVAHELAVPVDLVDVRSPDGQAALREATPVWKVPTAVVGESVLIGSHLITEVLLRDHRMTAPAPHSVLPWNADDPRMRNVMAVIDGALDALIQVMYLKRDGITTAQADYLQKNVDRAGACMAWLDAAVVDTSFQEDGSGLGLAEIALVTTLDWMTFRDTYDWQQHPALVRLHDQWGKRASFESTFPVE